MAAAHDSPHGRTTLRGHDMGTTQASNGTVPTSSASTDAADDGHDRRLLRPTETCWRTAHAEQFSRIVDGTDYLRHVKSSMLGATRRIMLIGWDLDYRTAFEADDAVLPGPNHLGPF